MTSEPLRTPLPGDPEAIHRWLEGSNPGHYRQLALYLQVLREVLPHSVDLAIHHLVTQLLPGRYARLDSDQRALFHCRVVDLVGRCCSLLTVEQLTSLAARIARDRQREQRRRQRRLLERLQASDPDEDEANGEDADPAEAVAAPPPFFSWGFEAANDPLPPGSVRLGMVPPLRGDLLGWFEGPADDPDRGRTPGEMLPEEGQDDLADLFAAAGEDDQDPELHDQAAASSDGGLSDEGGDPEAFRDAFGDDGTDELASALDAAGRDGDFENRFAHGWADALAADAFDKGVDRSLDSDFDRSSGSDNADPHDLADNQAGEGSPDEAPGRAGSDVIEGAMTAWALLRGSAGSGRSARSGPVEPGEDEEDAGDDDDDVPAWLPGSSAGGLLPREPLALLAWLELHELALARRLRNLSHALNVELLRAGLLQALLPASLLDAVLEGRIDPQGAPPNLLRLQLPMALPDLESPLQVTVLLLRCGDLELEQPRLRTVRRELQRRRQESRRMAQHYRRLQRRLQAREAEALWLQDIRQRGPGPATPGPATPPGQP